jgi:hypothetical protein
MTEPDMADIPEPRSLEPVTESIFRRLGGHRGVWIVLWSAIPLLSPFIFSTVIRATGRAFTDEAFVSGILTQAGVAWACLVLLWGSGHLASEARSTRDELRQAAPDQVPETIFGAIARRDGPVLLTAVVTSIVVANNWAAFGPLAPLATLPFFVASMAPIMTFMWVYVAILTDINRLGELPVVLDRFPQDRTMGLGRVGSLASTGLGALFLAAIPILLVGSDEPVTLAISLALVIAAIGSFGLSMWRLHRQMVAAKRRYVTDARRLYAEAYAPIRQHPDVGSLTGASTALSVAQSLDERAAGLPTWPIDDGTARFVAVIITGVITSLIVRALFAAIGF